MVKKVRWKIILYTTGLVCLFLILISASINLVVHSSNASAADHILWHLAYDEKTNPNGENPLNTSITVSETGTSEEVPFSKSAFEGTDDRPHFPSSDELLERSNYFTATFENRKLSEVNLKHFDALEKSEAEQIAGKIYALDREKGYFSSIYRYLRVDRGDSKVQIYVLDVAMQARNFLTLVTVTYSFCFANTLISFLVIFFVSKNLVTPLVISQQKQKRFISDASHELKTPLTIISANNELMEMQYGENDSTKIIAKEVQKMSSMITELNTLARYDEKEKEESAEFDLSKAYLDISSTFLNAFKEHGKRYTEEIQEGVKFFGNEASIRKLFSIVLDNALKYSLTECSATLKKENGKIVFDIANDAKDVQAQEYLSVFERFYRSENARGSAVKGSGIGLSLASRIAELNKIKLTAYGDKEGRFHIKALF